MISKKDAVALMDKYAGLLREHFESVHVFVTVVADDGEATTAFARGAGNWYARYGQVKYWVEQQDGIAREDKDTDGTGSGDDDDEETAF